MITCGGKSLIPISIGVYQKFMNSVVPPEKLPVFNITLDGRSNVRSLFAKLSGTDLTIYTGGIVNQGSAKFVEVSDPESLLMLFTLYGVKKAGQGKEFEIKSDDASVAAVKTDVDFYTLQGQLHFFMDRFRPLNAQAVSIPSMFDEDSVVQSPVGNGVILQSVPQESPVGPNVASSSGAVGEEKVEKKPKTTGKQKKEKTGPDVSPFKDVPLGDTPKITVPADLDLRVV